MLFIRLSPRTSAIEEHSLLLFKPCALIMWEEVDVR